MIKFGSTLHWEHFRSILVGLPAANQPGGWIRRREPERNSMWLVETVNSEPAVGTVMLLPGQDKSRSDVAINYMWQLDLVIANISGSNHRIPKPRRQNLALICSFVHAKLQLSENLSARD